MEILSSAVVVDLYLAWPSSDPDGELMADAWDKRIAALAGQVDAEGPASYAAATPKEIDLAPGAVRIASDRSEGLPFAGRVLDLQLDQLPLCRKRAPSYPPAEGDGIAVEDVIGRNGEGRGRLDAKSRLVFNRKDRRAAFVEEAELTGGPRLHRIDEAP